MPDPRLHGMDAVVPPDVPGGAAPVPCPFTVLVDSREREPYLFRSLRTNADRGSRPLAVTVMRYGLPVGDYSIFGLPQIAIERKSKADLFASVARRANFEGRLRRMDEERAFAAVVVEAQILDILTDPPAFSDYSPKALMRTITAWQQRYRGVHWVFAPSRAHAEAITFRHLERYYLDHAEEHKAGAGVVRGGDGLEEIGEIGGAR